MRITFKTLQENCSHQAAIKNGKKMCGYQAQCWDDWVVCNKKNCPILNSVELPKEIEGQMSLEDFFEKERV